MALTALFSRSSLNHAQICCYCGTGCLHAAILQAFSIFVCTKCSLLKLSFMHRSRQNSNLDSYPIANGPCRWEQLLGVSDVGEAQSLCVAARSPEVKIILNDSTKQTIAYDRQLPAVI